jgi:CheY-like chemotaxis protein
MLDPDCSKLVMVVEDDRDVRDTLLEVLEDAEYTPVAATNGQDALHQLRACDPKPCLILLDIMMPVMDGLQFRAVQRQDPTLQEIPVVVLSAHASAQHMAKELAVAEFLKKPVRLETLLAAVERYCGDEPSASNPPTQ